MRTEAQLVAKRRQNNNRCIRDKASFSALRQKGACCGNCADYDNGPKHHDKPLCERHSDWAGVSLAKPDGLCLDWSIKPESKE